MKSTTRRIPRKIGQDQDEETNSNGPTLMHEEDEYVVKRPAKGPRSKHNKSSILRTSFIAHEDSQDDGETPSTKPEQSRRLLERTGQLRASTSGALPLRVGAVNDRPSYSSDHLTELKYGTPPTPLNLDKDEAVSHDSSQSLGLDIISKFGDSALNLASPTHEIPSTIPSEAEIREKKERRRRLAKESDYISLNDDNNDDDRDIDAEASENDDPRSRSLIIPADEVDIPSKYGEGRLVHEDEDIAEGFDEFVEDPGKVTLGRKAAKEQELRRKQGIEEQIKSAQHGYGYAAGSETSEDGDSEEDEEAVRNAAYDSAQIRAGAYGVSSLLKLEMNKEEKLKRKLQLPKTRALPDFKAVVARFSDMLSAKQYEIEANKKRLARIEQEREEIDIEEERVKELLREAGVRYDRLKEEVNTKPTETSSDGKERGLESLAALEPLSTSDARPTYDGYESWRGPTLHTPSTYLNETIGSKGPLGMSRIHTEEDEYNN